MTIYKVLFQKGFHYESPYETSYYFTNKNTAEKHKKSMEDAIQNDIILCQKLDEELQELDERWVGDYDESYSDASDLIHDKYKTALFDSSMYDYYNVTIQEINVQED